MHDHGHKEGSRLSTTSGSYSDHVLQRQSDWDGLHLDGGGGLVFHSADRIANPF